MNARLQVAANIGLASWLMIDIGTSLWSYAHCDATAGIHRGAIDGLSAVALTWCAFLVLVRPVPVAGSTGWEAWTASVIGSCAPMLYACYPHPSTTVLAESAWTVGSLLMLLSISQLGTSFSVLPEVRSVVTGGLYAWVRHPLYASYLIADSSYWIADQSMGSLFVWLVELVSLSWRARLEEEVLVASDRYARYSTKVRSRLCPFIY